MLASSVPAGNLLGLNGHLDKTTVHGFVMVSLLCQKTWSHNYLSIQLVFAPDGGPTLQWVFFKRPWPDEMKMWLLQQHPGFPYPDVISPVAELKSTRTLHCPMCIGRWFMSFTPKIKLLTKHAWSSAKKKTEDVYCRLFTGEWLSGPIGGFAIPPLSCKQEKVRNFIIALSV